MNKTTNLTKLIHCFEFAVKYGNHSGHFGYTHNFVMGKALLYCEDHNNNKHRLLECITLS